MKRLFILALLLLSGCVQLPPMPPMPAKQLDSWHLNGRIAISTEYENWTAKVDWQQRGTAYQLRLNSPLGQGALLLDGDENGVVMHTAGNKTFKAADPDTLIANVLKLEFPVSNLHAWIRGLPAPNSYLQWYTLNDAGHLEQLRQDGWEVDYKRYIKVQGFDLPKLMVLENELFKVKIAISQWQLSAVPFKTMLSSRSKIF
jgi:outer membrane lipoprotein LolB